MYQNLLDFIKNQIGDDKDVQNIKMEVTETGGVVMYSVDYEDYKLAFTQNEDQFMVVDGEPELVGENEKGKKTDSADKSMTTENSGEGDKVETAKAADEMGGSETVDLLKQILAKMSEFMTSEKGKTEKLEVEKKTNEKSFEGETPEQRFERLQREINPNFNF